MVVLLLTESTVEIKAVYKDELIFVAYRSVNISSGRTCVYINSWPCVYSVVTCSGPSGTYLLCKVGSVCSHSFIPLAWAECDDSLHFSGASSVPLCYALVAATLLNHILPSSLTSSCHLFLSLLLRLVGPKFIYKTLLGIIFSSILCRCPNQRNLFNFIFSILLGFLMLA